MKILGLAGLYLFYREFTKGGVSPITVVPPSSPNGLTPQEKARQEERERARKEAEDASLEAERERQKKLDEAKRLADLRFRQAQERIRANPPNCGFGRTAQLRGAGTRDSPYGWECILTGF